MSTVQTEPFQTLTVSLPERIVRQLESMAIEESRDLSDVLMEGARKVILDRAGKRLDAIKDEIAKRAPCPYTEDDVVRLVDEVRAEMAAEREAESKLTA